MPKGKGHDVICPGCRESYHKTTESYDPNRDANAGMLELKAIYKSYGWDEPVPDPTAGYGILICPDCEAPLAPSGRLEVREKEVQQVQGVLVSKEATIGDPESISIGQEPIVIPSEDELPPLIVDVAGNIRFKCPHPDCADSNRKFKKKANLGSHMRVHKKGE